VLTERSLFDADAIRTLERRAVFLRGVDRPTLVLGSTQDVGIVDTEALIRHGVELVRRRSGGGAVGSLRINRRGCGGKRQQRGQGDKQGSSHACRMHL